jgi:acyl-CoA hydrolase
MAATPYKMLEALAEHVVDLKNIQLLQLHLGHTEAACQPHFQGNLRNRCYLISHSTRKLVNEGKVDYVPIFLSEIPKLFCSGRQPIDVALIQVSSPDHHGLLTVWQQ